MAFIPQLYCTVPVSPSRACRGPGRFLSCPPQHCSAPASSLTQQQPLSSPTSSQSSTLLLTVPLHPSPLLSSPPLFTSHLHSSLLAFSLFPISHIPSSLPVFSPPFFSPISSSSRTLCLSSLLSHPLPSRTLLLSPPLLLPCTWVLFQQLPGLVDQVHKEPGAQSDSGT